MVTSQQMLLGFYTLPTVASAYFYGRRHATLTAFGCVLLVVYLRLLNPDLLGGPPTTRSWSKTGWRSRPGAAP